MINRQHVQSIMAKLPDTSINAMQYLHHFHFEPWYSVSMIVNVGDWHEHCLAVTIKLQDSHLYCVLLMALPLVR